jgi:hypothetical protein
MRDYYIHLSNGRSRVVEQSTHHPKVKGLIPVTAGREKMAIKVSFSKKVFFSAIFL